MRFVSCLLFWGAVTTVWGRDGDLGEQCYRSGRCNIQEAECNEDSICLCRHPTVQNSKKNRCLPMVTELSLHCEEDVQCQTINSVCKRRTRLCTCRKGSVAATDKARCLPERLLGQPCEETAQCQNMTECNLESRSCVCQGISYAFNGQCVLDHTGQEWVLNEIVVTGGGTRIRHTGLLAGLLTVLTVIQVR